MHMIRRITRHELTWLRTDAFHRLFAQLTESTRVEDSMFERWFDELQNNPAA